MGPVYDINNEDEKPVNIFSSEEGSSEKTFLCPKISFNHGIRLYFSCVH